MTYARTTPLALFSMVRLMTWCRFDNSGHFTRNFDWLLYSFTPMYIIVSMYRFLMNICDSKTEEHMHITYKVLYIRRELGRWQ